MHNIKNLIMILCMLALLTGCGRQEALFVAAGDTETNMNGAVQTAETGDGDFQAGDNDGGDAQTAESGNSGTQSAETQTVKTGDGDTENDDIQTDTVSAEKIAVYVCGAVQNPGVYYLEATDIRDTAVRLAGGFTEEADTVYVNLAQRVTDGERIYVPTKTEAAEGLPLLESPESETVQSEAGGDSSPAQTATGKVNINTAGKEELMTLPGIGESKAQAIIAYRETQGKFQSTDELMNISGIKEGVYNKIKDLIVVN